MATRRFADIVTQKVKPTYSEIDESLRECFPPGMETSRVAKFLPPERGRRLENGDIEYAWLVDGTLDNGTPLSFGVVVTVYGTHPAIKETRTSPLPST
jgi:hypothetical protein